MENGLPALLIAAILMLSTVLMARGGFLGADAIGQSLRQSETRYGQQNRTGLTVTDASIDGVRREHHAHRAQRRPDADRRLREHGRRRAVLRRDAARATTSGSPYTSGALASDTWKTGTFTNDVFEPGILNAGESMEIAASA